METIFAGMGNFNDTALWNLISKKYPKITGEISHESALRCEKKCGSNECANSPHPTEEGVCKEGQLWQVIENPTPEQIKGNRVIGTIPVEGAALAAEYYHLTREGDDIKLMRYAVMTYTNFVRGTGQDVFPTWEWPQDD
ncbi:MAG: hypothetical protein WA093_00315 [Minisyncoccales bacterium]